MLRILSAVAALTLAIVATLLVGVLPAFAQSTVTAPSPTTVALGGWYDLVQPYLLMLFSAIVAALLGVITKVVHDKFGIDIQARDREAIHRAAMTGVASGLAMAGRRAADIEVDVRSPLVKGAVDWVQRSVPDAIGRLGVTPAKLEQVVLAKIGELQNAPVTPAAVEPAAPRLVR